MLVMNSMKMGSWREILGIAGMSEFEDRTRELGFQEIIIQCRLPDGRWSGYGKMDEAFSKGQSWDWRSTPHQIMGALNRASPLSAWWSVALQGTTSDRYSLGTVMKSSGIDDILGQVVQDQAGPLLIAHLICADRSRLPQEVELSASRIVYDLLFSLLRNNEYLCRFQRQAELSPREHEVLALLVAGKSNPEIAEALKTSINTIEFHLKNIFPKLGVYNRVRAAVVAVRSGLVI
ncbi:hypothetical protein A6A04_19680 [Paramagnetospirillum marisnigri]|uniref:HTH luxR-type domain-containing protein n=2 Tax=Paramagnetospirillum marisnigri TaxID=1285242 RepID=A0A178MJX8_9PROT|nr:hypothetical protein A6A04_19680 [Paramagnetospirillum marisnigri]